MSQNEIITNIISVLVIIISFVTIFRTRKISEAQGRLEQEQLNLQRITANLHQKQLEMLIKQEATSGSARVTVQLEHESRGEHAFVLKNVGAASAKDVSFELKPHGQGNSPIVQSDYKKKIPIPCLAPGNSVRVLAIFHLGTATAFEVVLKWTNPNGGVINDETFIAP